jgi:formylglycine-generating enzyme required for sulfatase activity
VKAGLEALRDLTWRWSQGECAALDPAALRAALEPLWGDLDTHRVGVEYLYEHGLAARGDADRLLLERDAARRRALWINPTDQSAMIWIHGGGFLQGRERRRVHLPGASVARDPVTNQQYAAFLEATGYDPAGGVMERFLEHWGDARALPAALADHPVVWVSLDDARAYARWAGLALPSPLLWEKAARGVDGRVWPWGEQPSPRALAHVQASGTAPVGSYPQTRSAWGCRDMVGNVAELCADPAQPRHALTPGGHFGHEPGPRSWFIGGMQRAERRLSTVGFRLAFL